MVKTLRMTKNERVRYKKYEGKMATDRSDGGRGTHKEYQEGIILK